MKGKDLLQFDWTVPDGIKVSSTSGSGIRYLAPVVNNPEIVEFSVSISDGTSKLVKNVPVSIMPYKPEFEQIKITRTAADNYNPNSYPDNAVDGNISTRWSADGEGQWIWFKLASPARINHILGISA